jgi:hypothetical protein
VGFDALLRVRMRRAAVTEGLRLVVDAAGLWWRRLLPMVTAYVLGFALHLLGLRLSVLLGPGYQVLATLVFVLAVAQVGALVPMLRLCRPPEDQETALDVAALAIGPFLAVYALWGHDSGGSRGILPAWTSRRRPSRVRSDGAARWCCVGAPRATRPSTS